MTIPTIVQIIEFVQITFHYCSTHFLIGVIGFIMMKSWMERTGNERLLNQLDDGVFLIGQETGELYFYNKASLQFNVFTKQLSRVLKGRQSADEENTFVQESESNFL